MQDTTSVPTVGPMFWIIWCAVIAFYIVCMWKLFVKAGKPGWASLIPIYNAVVLLDICGKPLWWIILFLIPLVNLFAVIMVYVALAKAFGKGTGFAIGLILLGLIFFPILAFGSATYTKPAAA